MDILCKVCNEPWDSHGVYSGDMTEWEKRLFLNEVGCPCCNRRGYENKNWKKPDEKVYWTCEGCGVQVIGNPDYVDTHENHLEYYSPIDSIGRSWFSSHQYETGEPTKEPAHTFGESNVCEFCYCECENCDTPLCEHLEYGDVYDKGYVFYSEGYSIGGKNDPFCIDCYSSICNTCKGLPQDCECSYCSCCGNQSMNCDECNCECETCDKCKGKNNKDRIELP